MATAGKVTSGVNVAKLKTNILHPALTSTYSVIIAPKQPVLDFFTNQQITFDTELLELSCSEASLPGSSIATIDINNDYMGVGEKHAYRRLYDDRADFTFYVTLNQNYNQIKIFDAWMKYITNEQFAKGIDKDQFVSRVQFPNNYKSSIKIIKFEKDYSTGRSGSSNILVYEFVGAYPVSMNSIPVSYDSSQLLKVTVSFVYTRYYISQENSVKENTDSTASNPSSPGNPELKGTTTTSGANQTKTSRDINEIRSMQEASRLRQAGYSPGLGQSGRYGPGF